MMWCSTDLMMPGGLDGLGVLDAAKERHGGRTEVILITAFASVKMRLRPCAKALLITSKNRSIMMN